jgi:recombination associated protein RdgC
MFFKQAQLFQLSQSMGSANELIKNLEKLSFKECLPSMLSSVGWVSPIDEDEAPLVQAISGYMMICMQFEEKILPNSVVRQELAKKIKEIEMTEARRVGQKEKLRLKDDFTAVLLPRAFTKLTKIYAYIDTKNRWLILGTTNAKKTEQFISIFKKSLGDTIHSFQIKKLSTLMTTWLTQQNHGSSFSIEKSCVMQDANHQNRVIRCREQNLFANSIQSLIKDGCEIKQLALNWQDHIDFVLADDLSLQSIRFKDEVIQQAKDMEAETQQQKFHADFLIMTGTLEGLIKDLLDACVDDEVKTIEAAHIGSKIKKAELELIEV